MEWVATGRVFSAEEALAGGLVRSVHPADGCSPRLARSLREIAENTAPVSVALARRLHVDDARREPPDGGPPRRLTGMFARGQSADAREGIAAFLEKRAASSRTA